MLPGNFDLSLTGTETSPWKYSYMANEMDNVTATWQGVVSPNGSGGYQGALTINPSNQDTPFVSSLLPQFQPSPYQFLGENGTNSFPMVSTIAINPDGSASGTLYQSQYQDGRWGSSSYSLTQTVPSTSASTPISATYNFQETYNGAMMLGGSSNLSNANGFGWGQRSFNGTGSTAATSIYNSYFAAWDNGTWTATSGSLPGYYGSSLAPGSGTARRRHDHRFNERHPGKYPQRQHDLRGQPPERRQFQLLRSGDHGQQRLHNLQLPEWRRLHLRLGLSRRRQRHGYGDDESRPGLPFPPDDDRQ